MKVKQEGTDFAPITITLETKEEADLMWAALNSLPENLVLSSKGRFCHRDELLSVQYNMWETFNSVCG